MGPDVTIRYAENNNFHSKSSSDRTVWAGRSAGAGCSAGQDAGHYHDTFTKNPCGQAANRDGHAYRDTVDP
jgi:hypothetical protein